MAMLREMRTFLASDPAPQEVSWSMADTAMWEVAKRRADTLPRDGAPGSRLMLEPILDEIRLLGPDAFEAACCRSLLRVFAADFAKREGMAFDREQAARRRRRVQDQPGPRTGRRVHAVPGRQRPVSGRLRAACRHRRDGALGLRAGRMGRVRAPSRRSAAEGGVCTAVGQGQGQAGRRRAAGGSSRRRAAIEWYFAQRRGTAVPDDLAGYARSCGFADEQAFQTAVRREYQYAYHRPQLRGNAP